jgi:hypothetical protein
MTVETAAELPVAGMVGTPVFRENAYPRGV